MILIPSQNGIKNVEQNLNLMYQNRKLNFHCEVGTIKFWAKIVLKSKSKYLLSTCIEL